VAKELLSIGLVGDQEVQVNKNITSVACVFSEGARLDCAERELSYLRPLNSDLS